MNRFRKILSIIKLICLTLLFSQCAAPGSGLTRFSVTGQIKLDTTTNDKHAFELILPEHYGLSGLDARMGQPSDYGHFRQDTIILTDSNGNFYHLFEPTTYSAVFWIIPPLGFRPKYGPPPFFGVKLDKFSPFIYVIAYPKEQFDYKVYDIRTNKYLDSNQTDEIKQLTGNLEKYQFKDNDDDKYGIKGWKVNLEILPNNYFLTDTINKQNCE